MVEPLPELDRPVGEVLVGQRLHLGLELVDQGDELGQPADLLSLAGAQDAREDAHETRSLPPGADPAATRSGRRPSGGRGCRPGAARRLVRSRTAGLECRGWERPTSFPFNRSTWCSSLSTTRSTATGASRAGGLGPDGVAVTGDGHLAHLPAPIPAASRSSERRTSARSSTGVSRAELGHLRLGQRPHFFGHRLLASQNDDVHRCTSFRPRVAVLAVPARLIMFDALWTASG